MMQMPNLHTLQIVHAHTAITTHLKNGFEGFSLPNVRKIILPAQAHEVLRCCPEVRHVICTGWDASKLVSAIAKCCKKVEILEGFDLNNPKIMKRTSSIWTSDESDLDLMCNRTCQGCSQLEARGFRIESFQCQLLSSLVILPLYLFASGCNYQPLRVQEVGRDSRIPLDNPQGSGIGCLSHSLAGVPNLYRRHNESSSQAAWDKAYLGPSYRSR
jgi:hypothetical protein